MIRALRRLFAPLPAPKPRTASRPPQVANTVDHRTPVPAMGLYVHRLLSKFNRLQLASVARSLWDNVGLVFYATALVANYSTPMIPRAATLDRKWNEAANTFFDDWADRADFTGRFDFWDLQRLGSFYLDTDGEVFALWTNHAGFPQLQFLESWRIEKATVADDRIFDGVQLDTKAESSATGWTARPSSTPTLWSTSSIWSATPTTGASARSAEVPTTCGTGATSRGSRRCFPSSPLS